MAACIYCGGTSYIVDTRLTNVSYVRRRRKCSDCGERFTTHEIPVPDRHAREIVEWAADQAKGPINE